MTVRTELTKVRDKLIAVEELLLSVQEESFIEDKTKENAVFYRNQLEELAFLIEKVDAKVMMIKRNE